MSRLVWEDSFTGNGSGAWRQAPDLGTIISITAMETGSGAVAASVQLEGSNNGVDAYPVGAPIALSGTAPQSGVATRVQFSFAQYRVTVSGISGTNAKVVTDVCIGA